MAEKIRHAGEMHRSYLSWKNGKLLKDIKQGSYVVSFMNKKDNFRMDSRWNVTYKTKIFCGTTCWSKLLNLRSYAFGILR